MTYKHSEEHLRIVFVRLLALCVIVFLFWAQSADQPLIDHFSFRQAQTAMTAYWFDWSRPVEAFFYPVTPELGAPWLIPHEFPLYQSTVAAFSEASGVALTTSGRMITSILFILTLLVPMRSLVRALSMEPHVYGVSALWLITSPLYLYWNRTFMIESMAFFFGFCYLAVLAWAIARGGFIGYGLASVCAAFCGLVKATTLPSFGFAALGLLVWMCPIGNLRAWWASHARASVAVIATVAVSVAVTALWTRHADSVKSTSPLAKHLTSGSLHRWIYGTTEQRTGRSFVDHVLVETPRRTLGTHWVVLVVLPALARGTARDRIQMLALLALYAIPPLLFANLYLVHDYYRYANAFWLVFAVSHGLSVLVRPLRRSYLRLSLVALVATGVAAFQIHTYFAYYYAVTTVRGSDAVDVGVWLRENTPSGTAIMVVGDSWSPEVAFYAQRKALYIPDWLGDFFPVDVKAIELAIAQPESMLDGLPLAAIVVGPRDVPPYQVVALHSLLANRSEELRYIRLNQAYGVFLAHRVPVSTEVGMRGRVGMIPTRVCETSSAQRLDH